MHQRNRMNIYLYDLHEVSVEMMHNLLREDGCVKGYCIEDEKYDTQNFNGLDVYPISEIKKGNDDFKIYITTPDEYLNDVMTGLINNNIFTNDQIINEFKEKYVSCEYLEQGMIMCSQGVLHCCGKISEDFVDTDRMKYGELFENDPDQFIQKFIDEKKQIIAGNRAGEVTKCTGCSYMKEGYWFKDKKIRYIDFSFDNTCNFRCIYCFTVRHDDYQFVTDIDEVDMIKKVLDSKHVDIQKQLIYSSGEIAIQPNVEKILDLLDKFDLSVFTNASLYNKHIHDIIKRDNCSMVISVDSGTRETFKKVKGVDLFHVVWKNIGKYAEDNGNVILKYILMEDNYDNQNLDGFIELCKEHGIKHIRISRNWHYDGDKIERGVLEASMRLMRRAKKAGLITHNDGVTQI